MTLHTLLAFGGYFSILVLIGVLTHKKNASEADFLVGGRGLNYWVTALTAHATDMSSWLFMAFPMAIYVGGLANAWIAVGLLLGMYLCWQFIAPKLRVATEEYDCYSLSAFFEKRFQDESGIVRMVSAVMILIFTVHYLSAGLIGMGFIFETLFSFDYHWSIIGATILIAIHTAHGGFTTVAWTDFFQGVFLLCVLLTVPFVAFGQLDGGFTAIQQAAELKQVSILTLIPDVSIRGILSVLFLVFGWGLGYFGQPHILTKFIGIKHPEELKKSKIVGMTWQLLALTAAALVGIVAIGFFPASIANTELVFVEMVKQIFPPLITGFVLCGILAATVTTMDSQIIVTATVLTEDVYRLLIRKNATDHELVTFSRVATVSSALFALLLAYNKNTTVMDTVTYSWSGLGCSFGPLMIMSLYYPKTNRWGAIAGILSGGLVAGGWNYFSVEVAGLAIPAMIPGFLTGLTMIWLGSNLVLCNKSAESKFEF